METIHVMGDPAHALDELAGQLGEQGFEVVVNGPPVFGGFVLFAVSAQDGPSVPGLDEARKWVGNSVHFLGLVYTKVGDDIDTDLLELITLEMQELLFSGVDMLMEVYLINDLEMPGAIFQQLEDPPAQISLRVKSIPEPEDEGVEEAIPEKRQRSIKPWWKFW